MSRTILDVVSKVALVISGLVALAVLVLLGILAWAYLTTRPKEVHTAVWRPPAVDSALPNLRLVGVEWTTIARQEVVLACGTRAPREVRRAYWMGPDQWANHEEVRVEWTTSRVVLRPPPRLDRVPGIDSVIFDEADFARLQGCQ